MGIDIINEGTATIGYSVGTATLSSPTSAVVSSTALSGTVTTDQTTGTLYWYVSTSATPPSVANHKDGTSSDSFGNQSVTAGGVNVISSMGGLTASTGHYVHYLYNTAGGDTNQVVATL